MNFTAKQIAEFLKGTVEGDPQISVGDLSKIEEGRPGTIAFLANPKYEKYIYETEASVVLVNNDFLANKPLKCTLIRVENAYSSIAALLELKEQLRPKPTGISEKSDIEPGVKYGENLYVGHYSVISAGVTIGNNVMIYPQAYIGANVVIGDNCIIHPGVKIYHDCLIGNNCTIHSGTVIGSDGFGFAPQSDQNYKKIPQVGNVVLEDFVEIGSNTTIDRAMMGSTIIKRGVKLDNLIQIAHNVEIGENTVIAAQTGIAGSSKIGKNCMFGGQVGIVGHLTIADGVKIAAQSGIASAIKNRDEIVQGTPAFQYIPFQKSYVFFKKLPEIGRRVSELENEVKKLRNESSVKGD